MSFVANFLLFVLVALAGGLGSAWYMVEKGSRLSTRQLGAWVSWSSAGRIDADPYTRAHFARSGRLPVTATTERTYWASIDNEGGALRSSCEYAIEGRGPSAEWWSLSVFDERGFLIRNLAERYAFNNTTVVRGPSGDYVISLARDARPGNWLPTGGGGRLRLMLNVNQMRLSEQVAGDEAERRELPTIRRVACR